MATSHPSPVAALQTKIRPSTGPSLAARSISLRSSSSIAPLRLRLRLRHRRLRGGPIMMDTAAGSYAAALAQVAKSSSSLDATCEDMEKVSKLFSDPSIASFFVNPTITEEKKEALIDEFASSSSLQPHTANFLKVVLGNKRVDIVQEMVKEFEAKYNAMTGTEVAVVSSVVPLESTHLAQIAKTVQSLTKAKNVRIKTKIDETLVAGFTIRYGNSGSKFIDMSVKKQLEEIARQLEFDVVLAGA